MFALWRSQKSLRKHQDPITSNSCIELRVEHFLDRKYTSNSKSRARFQTKVHSTQFILRDNQLRALFFPIASQFTI